MGTNMNYTDEDMEMAKTMVLSGQLSLRKAGENFKIPKSTLARHVNGESDVSRKPGRQPIIPQHVERDVAEIAKDAAECGFGYTKSMIQHKVGKVASLMNTKVPWKLVPGNGWWQGFKIRNPNMVLRTPQALADVRCRGVNRTTAGRYFILLYQNLKDHDLFGKPQHVWNMDETSMSMQHKPPKILAIRGMKNLKIRSSNSRETVSVVGCGNAVGRFNPPLIIVPGKTIQTLHTCNVSEGPVDAKWTFQDKGVMDDSLSVEWFKKCFLPYIGLERPQMLILDNHRSHETIDLLVEAKANGIVIVAFPSHSTAHLCPLDKTVYSPLKGRWDHIVAEFLAQNHLNVMNKTTFAARFKHVWMDMATPSNMISGFRATGIFPFNPLAVAPSSFAPSLVFEECMEGGVPPLKKDEHPLQWALNHIVGATTLANLHNQVLVIAFT